MRRCLHVTPPPQLISAAAGSSLYLNRMSEKRALQDMEEQQRAPVLCVRFLLRAVGSKARFPVPLRVSRSGFGSYGCRERRARVHGPSEPQNHVDQGVQRFTEVQMNLHSGSAQK
ncbi:hypothetical protein FQA47_001235 [Oryzias melastigma]|uniref:Uncharacterized protein n=1 Tax=Oryzias melastigma TaxID=30732 RepID=A0A834L0P4_ORYME|nr:hypothetical protein FQA47_001235 [Oryzias melastigma]